MNQMMRIQMMTMNKQRLSFLQGIADAFYAEISRLPIKNIGCHIIPLDEGEDCRVTASGYLIDGDEISIHTVSHEQVINTADIKSITHSIRIFTAMLEKKATKIMVH